MEFNILMGIDDSKSEALRDNYEEQKNLITSDQSRVRELYILDRQVITNTRFIIFYRAVFFKYLVQFLPSQ